MGTYQVQLAIRDSEEGVHVQVQGNPADFVEKTRRGYGAAFNLKDDFLEDLVESRTPTRKSLAGSARLYVPAEMENDGWGDVTIEFRKVNNGGLFNSLKGLFSSKTEDVEYFTFDENDITYQSQL